MNLKLKHNNRYCSKQTQVINSKRIQTPKWYLIILLLLLSGCLNPVRELYPENEQQRPVSVYVVKLGWHAAIVIEGQHLRAKLPTHERLPDSEFLMVGWGDDHYYPADRPRVDLFFRAAFLFSGSVIHLGGFDIAVEKYFSGSDIVRIQVSEQGMEAMSDYLVEQFAYNKEGGLQYVGIGLFGQSAFFKATGLYYFPRTSNWWTAKVLRKSGFPITPIYAVTSGNVMRQVGKCGTVIQNP